MGKTTRQTVTAGQKRVADIQPNVATGKPAPAPAANAFLGRREHVPQLVYFADIPNDGFLGEAKAFYEFFGIEVKPVKSVHDVVIDLGKRQGVFERIAIVSHAHPRGMLLPMFTGAVPGTNKELFQGLAKSDYDGLLVMTPFDEHHHHLFEWSTRIDPLMKVVRSKAAAALKPLGLDKSGTPAAGDAREFFFHCFDIVMLNKPGTVKLDGNAVDASQRGILEKFIDEVLNQLTKRLDGKTINGRRVSANEWIALGASVTAIAFDDLNMTATFNLDLEPDSMNLFPSLNVMINAVRNGLRTQLEAARTHLGATSLVDIRGCRVGADGDYLAAIGAFLGTPGAHPTVTGPQRFEAFPPLFFDTLNSRSNIRVWLSKTQRQHSPQKLRELLTTWAEFIRVRPLHTDFWTGVLEGNAVRLLALAEKDIPRLFIAAPGLKQTTDPDVKKMVAAVADLFNVPKADVPKAPALTALVTAAASVKPAASVLLAPAPDATAAPKLQSLYEKLRDLDAAAGQTIVPDTPPAPLSAADIRDYQKRLLEHFDTTSLAPLKKLMTAAAKSLNEGDGLFYYMFQAGLPAFIFGRPETAKNSIVVFTPHAKVVQQSWYQCLWKEPLPDTGAYKTAKISAKLAHTLPTLFEEDRTTVASVCPLPRFGFCIRTRPLPPGEPDNECDSLSNP
jgi:hypothetical protein